VWVVGVQQELVAINDETVTLPSSLNSSDAELLDVADDTTMPDGKGVP